ncbi:MAG: O-antigen ligase family protein [Sumerlaeia bacterium]
MLRSMCAGVVLGLMGLFLWGGTYESRAVYLFTFAMGALNPVWGLYGLALVGPLYLVDAGKTHMLVTIDVLVLGAIFGELRSIGQERLESVRWGLWPRAAVGFWLLILASSVVGMLFVFLSENEIGRPDRVLLHSSAAFYDYATQTEWPLRALYNFAAGLGIAAVAARRASRGLAMRFLGCAAAGLLVACSLSLMNWGGLLSMHDLHRTNYDPLHRGRLQGTAGHAGWFGQWIVIAWPGILLLALARGRKALIAMAGALTLVGLCLMLTAARAAWLGVGAGVLMGGLYLLRSRPELSKLLLWGGIGAAAIGLAGFALGGDVLARRFENLLRVTDRANYYLSGLVFLREHPLGLGLGMHAHYYNEWFNPFFRYFQTDHVTSHSLYLHLLIENGPFVLGAFVFGLLFLAFEVRAAWPEWDRTERWVVVVLAMAFGGILVDGVAQYIFYIRPVEFTFWVLFGLILGLSRKAQAASAPLPAPAVGGGPMLLAAAGLVAVLMASVNIRRPIEDRFPRAWDVTVVEDRLELSRWTDEVFRMPIDPEARRIQFSLHRKEFPTQVTIEWPDGESESFPMEAGAYVWRERTLAPAEKTGPLAPRRWLTIRVSQTFSPARLHPGESGDIRDLGVYIFGFRIE